LDFLCFISAGSICLGMRTFWAFCVIDGVQFLWKWKLWLGFG